MEPDLEDLISRLNNWKFAQALQYTNAETKNVEVITALAMLFGNSGWFQGQIGILLDYVVEYLIRELSGKP